MEDKVDEKFYLSEDKVKRFISSSNKLDSLMYDPCQAKREGKSRECSDFAPTLASRDYKDPRLINETELHNEVKQVGNIADTGNWNNPQTGRIYSQDGISPTLNTCGGGGHEPKIVESLDNVNPSGRGMNGNVYNIDGVAPTVTVNKGDGSRIAIPQATKQGYIECEVGDVADLSYPDSKTRRGRVQENGNCCQTITASETEICKIEPGIRIRRLTPKECFRLMGFSDNDFYAAQNAGISNSQLYKQAGNSIVTDVLYYIYVELYKSMPYLFGNLKLSSFFSGIGAFEIALDRLYEGINTGNFTQPQMD